VVPPKSTPICPANFALSFQPSGSQTSSQEALLDGWCKKFEGKEVKLIVDRLSSLTFFEFFRLRILVSRFFDLFFLSPPAIHAGNDFLIVRDTRLLKGSLLVKSQINEEKS